MNIGCDTSAHNRSLNRSAIKDLDMSFSDMDGVSYFSNKMKELSEMRNKFNINSKDMNYSAVEEDACAFISDNDDDFEDRQENLAKKIQKQSKPTTNSKSRINKQSTVRKKTNNSSIISITRDIASASNKINRRGKKDLNPSTSDYNSDLSIEISNKEPAVPKKKGVKRGRKSKVAAKKTSLHNISPEVLLGDAVRPGVCTRASKRARTSKNGTSPLSLDIYSPPVNNVRGRNRSGRGSTTRNLSRHSKRLNQQSLLNNMPTYSVGNTDEYIDLCEDVGLFNKQISKDDEVIILDNTEDVHDNEELSVKVLWKTVNVFKFKLRKYQKLKHIFDTFAEQENISSDKLFFTYNNKILKCDDTPDSIDYDITEFIDGGVVSDSVNGLVNDRKQSNGGLKIKFQCQNSKKPMHFYLEKNEAMAIVMTQCAEQLETPLSKLKFEFDGEGFAGTSTPIQIGLESGDCIDVSIID